MLADRIDSGQLVELAARHATYTGSLETAQLPRLAALRAAGDDACLDVTVSFAPTEHGLARLDMTLQGDLHLVCQRCLEPLAWTVRLQAGLAVLASEDDAQYLEDPFESVVMESGGLQLARIAEDEVLASVPLAPVHEAEPACHAPAEADRKGGDAAGGSSRPFAGLAEMLKAGQRQTD